MVVFSHPFELAYVEKDVREDKVVVGREYYVIFNTILGEMFVHNLLSINYDWLDNSFYHLPSLAQLFYRKFLIHHDYPETHLNLTTIKKQLNLTDKNITNLMNTIETSALQPLIAARLISSYQIDQEGLNGLKFTIKRTPAQSSKHTNQE